MEVVVVEENEFIQNLACTRRDSKRGGTNQLSRNAGSKQTADDTRPSAS